MMKEYLKEIDPRGNDEKVQNVLDADLSESDEETLGHKFDKT